MKLPLPPQIQPTNEMLRLVAAEALDANRNTLKGKFGELTGKGLLRLHGKGRGAYYRPT